MRRAAAGDYPPADGLVEVMSAPPGRLCGVLAFTAHHIVAADVEPEWVRARLVPGDLITPMGPRFLSALAEETGTIPGVLDAVLCAPARQGKPEVPLVELPPGVDHPRVAHARLLRTDLRVYGTPDGEGVLIIGRGLAGRWEASFEVAEPRRNRGLGRALVRAALTLLPPGEPVFMQVSPGNAASLRAVLAGGFHPIGSEMLFRRIGSG